MNNTQAIITPILERTYGKGNMVDALAALLAARIDNWPNAPEYEKSRGREYIVMSICWDWMTGGDTAEYVAKKIEAVLPS
jgi:hypothetical protein